MYSKFLLKMMKFYWVFHFHLQENLQSFPFESSFQYSTTIFVKEAFLMYQIGLDEHLSILLLVNFENWNFSEKIRHNWNIQKCWFCLRLKNKVEFFLVFFLISKHMKKSQIWGINVLFAILCIGIYNLNSTYIMINHKYEFSIRVGSPKMYSIKSPLFES